MRPRVDPAVALVQAYLQLNGYFTVAEYPIVIPGPDAGEVLTDVDLIALRFPHARSLGVTSEEGQANDPALAAEPGEMDLLICEVKEGKGRVNPNLTRDDVLAATLRRVGCCPEPEVAHHVRELLRHGVTAMHHGGVRCRARVAVFAGRGGEPARAALAVPLTHVARFVARHLQEHARLLQAAHLTQPALAYLQLLGKLGVLHRGA